MPRTALSWTSYWSWISATTLNQKKKREIRLFCLKFKPKTETRKPPFVCRSAFVLRRWGSLSRGREQYSMNCTTRTCTGERCWGVCLCRTYRKRRGFHLRKSTIRNLSLGSVCVLSIRMMARSSTSPLRTRVLKHARWERLTDTEHQRMVSKKNAALLLLANTETM